MSIPHTIPYGISNYPQLRRNNGYFVDRTSLLPRLEELPYQLFLRPRRFGKSLLLSILESYYDVRQRDDFDALFAGTWIHGHPTPERGRYLVLRLDFSAVRGDSVEELQRDFESYCRIRLDAFVDQYETFLPGALRGRMDGLPSFGERFNALISSLRDCPHKLYLLIDEYDNFTNNVLASHGQEFYDALCHGDGFFKGFFKQLKAATASASVERIFLTGVSPVTVDDVTSGFNIAENVSLEPGLSTLCGFTHADVRACLREFAEAGRFRPDPEEAFRVARAWYDNYRFSRDSAETVCNPILFFGFLRSSIASGHLPDTMLDENAHTDYAKLRHLVTTGGRLNGEFRVIERLCADGEMTVPRLPRSFQARELHVPENFASLLFHHGLVTIGGGERGQLRLVVPNQVVREMLAGMVRDGYRDICGVRAPASEIACALGDFARDGAWRGALEAAAASVGEAVSARDLLDGEKAVQAALAAFLAVGNAFMVRTECQAGSGFADLALIPRLAVYPDIRHCALIEVKYLPPKERPPKSLRQRLLDEARGQLERYAAARNIREEWRLAPAGPVTLHPLLAVFHGAKLLWLEEM